MYIYNEWKELKSFIKSIDPIQELIDYPNEPLASPFDRTGIKHTKESKKKMSLAHKGKTLSEEHKKNVSLGMMGNKNGNGDGWALKGIPLSEEHKKKISLAKTGKKRKGIPLSEEHKMNISRAKTGKKRKPFSEETKRKMSLGQKARHKH